jgi:hypothetical protein
MSIQYLFGITSLVLWEKAMPSDFLRLRSLPEARYLIYFAGAGVAFQVSIRIFQSSPSRITDQ